MKTPKLKPCPGELTIELSFVSDPLNEAAPVITTDQI